MINLFYSLQSGMVLAYNQGPVVETAPDSMGVLSVPDNTEFLNIDNVPAFRIVNNMPVPL